MPEKINNYTKKVNNCPKKIKIVKKKVLKKYQKLFFLNDIKSLKIYNKKVKKIKFQKNV